VTPDLPATAHQVAVASAEAAGQLLRHRLLQGGRHPDSLEVRAKGTAGDVVTGLDLAAEKLIVARIRDAFPRHRIIAEEGGLAGAGDSAWTWLVDPLDGTNNVAVGLTACVVGIALCADGIPVLGVIHDPILRQTWSAIRGRGAVGPDGQRLCAGIRPMSRVLAWTQGYGVPRGDHAAGALKLVLEAGSHRLLQLWAPLLSWVMLSRGVIDGIVGYQPEEIDLPAGALIATEAGIVIRTLDGGPFSGRLGESAQARSFVAGRPEIAGALLSLVASAKELRSTWPEPKLPW
jgi:myo-inositol-1(or 4)-monophosphatase